MNSIKAGHNPPSVRYGSPSVRRPNPAYKKATHGLWFPALQMSPEDSSSPLAPKNRIKLARKSGGCSR